MCWVCVMRSLFSLEPFMHKIHLSVQVLFLPALSSSVVLSIYTDDVVVFINNHPDIDI